MQGILLIDKPSGWTSFDVVNFVRKQVAVQEGKKSKNVKVGHTGTLDPLATGLLVLLVGKEYTRRATEFIKWDKTYEVTMKLGETSVTGDAEGDRQFVSNAQPTREDVVSALDHFTGEVMQKPPAFSAMKVNGQRAYKLAREGKPVELEARPVHIYANMLTAYSYPYVQFTSEVGSGTYIRSLVEDIGVTLDTGAYMYGLRRTRAGHFDIAQAHDVQDPDLLQYLAPFVS